MLPDALEELLDEHKVALLLGKPVPTLRRWRLNDEGPPYIKVGRAVRYKPSDLAAWLAKCPSGGSKQEGR